MSTEQTQEPKCPVGGDKTSTENTAKTMGIDEAFQPAFRALLAVMAETIEEGEERETFIKEAHLPGSPIYFILHGAFLAGIHYAIHVPAMVAVHEFAMWKLKANPAKADEVLTKMKEALAGRPDETEAPHAE